MKLQINTLELLQNKNKPKTCYFEQLTRIVFCSGNEKSPIRLNFKNSFVALLSGMTGISYFAKTLLLLLGIILSGCSTGQEIIYKAKLVQPPVATKQLGPAIFLPSNVLNKIVNKEGDIILVSHSKNKKELRAYKFWQGDSTFAVQKEFADSFNFKYQNEYTLYLKKTLNPKLKPKPIKYIVENYKGNNKKWKYIAIGAPHGDCDLETGKVVKLVTQKYGIPSTAAYGARLSYRGIWYDCNRPLMKLPKKNHKGVIPSRVWNKDAEEKYFIYQDSLWSNSNLNYGKRFELFTSFHGHDLTVKLPDGKKIQRPVIEGMGIGFSQNELRRIKNFYNRNKHKYYKEPPALYFGNLPEDRTYYYKGIPLNFFYSGLGTRTYGSLKSDLVKNALHFETPNSMRIKKQARHKTADFLFDIYQFVIDSIFTKRNNINIFHVPVKPEYLTNKVKIPAGTFLMGAPDSIGWSSEHPQHKVYVDNFYIDRYEVSNLQFVDFLNKAYNKGLIKVIDGVVKDALNIEHNICSTKKINPFSEIEFVNNKFKVIKNRDYFPVIFVSYYGAKMFAESNNSRLPTEAEWEKAASWMNGRKFLFSVTDSIKNAKINFEDNNDIYENSFPGTTPVGYFKNSNINGTYDMNGNVWEWCSDNYEYNYYKNNPDKIWNNPKGPKKSSMKVIKGGAYNTEYFVTRSTMRLGIHPNQMLCNVGFRCVKGNK